jgi:ATP-dependent exoDNAse (exonuclease V) beta subunit
VDLLSWTDAGGQLDYQRPVQDVPPGSPVAEAFGSLKAFHDLAHTRPGAYVAEAFIRDRCLAVQAFGQARPRDAWRRLRYVVAQARRLAAAGQPSLREALDWLEGLQSGRFFDPDSPAAEADDDAVRLLTVHAAKGLEFPIVILTGLGASPPSPIGPEMLADHRTGQLELRIGRDWRTAHYDEAHDRAAHEAEQVRLLYVAATRARDHLVLCLFHDQRQSPAKRILQRLESAPELCIELDLSDEPSSPSMEAAAAPDDEPTLSLDEHRIAEEAWLGNRQRQIAALGVRPRWTPSQLAHAPVSGHGAGAALATETPARDAGTELELEDEPAADELAEDAAPVWGGRGATALGRCVHAVLQRVSWEAAPLELPRLAAHTARGFGIEQRTAEVQRLAEAVLASPAVQAARTAARAWREAPVGVDVDGVLLEGYIDLLYERADGQLVVVDYKTDHISFAELHERANAYRLQGGAYALAVERATNRTVAQVQLVFAALDGETVIIQNEELRAVKQDVESRMAVPL